MAQVALKGGHRDCEIHGVVLPQPAQSGAACLVHASCVAFAGAGVLLLGASGSGKSDLALRCLEGGGVLVADDVTRLERRVRAVAASAPQALCGKLELYGVGIFERPYLASATLVLVVELVSTPVARMPAPARLAVLGGWVAKIALRPFECSAPAKLRLAALAAADAAGKAGVAPS